jgi:homogentisate 1,2-dioxygenase
VKSEGLADMAGEAPLAPNHPLLPRHFRTQDLPAGGDLVLGRQLMMANDDVRIYFAAANADSDLYRNSSGDEAVYCGPVGHIRVGLRHHPGGRRRLRIVPRGTIHRWRRAASACSGHRSARSHPSAAPYLSQYGQFLSTRRTASAICAGRRPAARHRGTSR